jgi:hypothetical protein
MAVPSLYQMIPGPGVGKNQDQAAISETAAITPSGVRR